MDDPLAATKALTLLGVAVQATMTPELRRLFGRDRESIPGDPTEGGEIPWTWRQTSQWGPLRNPVQFCTGDSATGSRLRP